MRATQAEHEIVFEEFEEDVAAEAAEAAQQPPVMKPTELPPPTKSISPGAISPSARCDLGPGAKRREERSGHHSSYQHLQLVAVREGQPYSERGGQPAPQSPHQQRGRAPLGSAEIVPSQQCAAQRSVIPSAKCDAAPLAPCQAPLTPLAPRHDPPPQPVLGTPSGQERDATSMGLKGQPIDGEGCGTKSTASKAGQASTHRSVSHPDRFDAQRSAAESDAEDRGETRKGSGQCAMAPIPRGDATGADEAMYFADP